MVYEDMRFHIRIHPIYLKKWESGFYIRAKSFDDAVKIARSILESIPIEVGVLIFTSRKGDVDG